MLHDSYTDFALGRMDAAAHMALALKIARPASLLEHTTLVHRLRLCQSFVVVIEIDGFWRKATEAERETGIYRSKRRLMVEMPKTKQLRLIA